MPLQTPTLNTMLDAKRLHPREFLSRESHILFLNKAVMAHHIISYIKFTPSSLHSQELNIAHKYLQRCSEPALRHYIHALPEILTVMDLMSIYGTEFSTDQNIQAYIRRTRAHAQRVLHRTFRQLIDTSRRRYRNQTPTVRPHKFQDPAHDKLHDIIELIYLLASKTVT